MSQTYQVEVDEAARTLACDLLDVVSVSGSRADGRRRERAHAALSVEGDAVTLTMENAEAILNVIDRALEPGVMPDGSKRPSTLTGKGFRVLSIFISRLEAVTKGERCAGVQALTLTEVIEKAAE